MINKVIFKLYEILNEEIKMSCKSAEIYNNFKYNTRLECNELIKEIDTFLNLNVNYTFSEEVFKIFWQYGFFVRKWNIFKDKEIYINTISKYVGLYGTPIEKDTIIYKAVVENEDLFGGSWTKDLKSALNFAVKHGHDKIVTMTIPKGTKSIHFYPNFLFKESEDLIDTSKVINKTLDDYAVLINRVIDFKGRRPIVKGVFNNLYSGGQFTYELDKDDSNIVFQRNFDFIEAA